MSKKFADLKNKQKEYIQEELFKTYSSIAVEIGHVPTSKQTEQILDVVYNQITEKGIVISREEVRQYYCSKRNRFSKRLLLNQNM